MARKITKKDNRYLARLVTADRVPCAFCLRDVDDEVTYGKLYAIGDIQCHYFCCLLSCCLMQKGHDEEGLFGFMYTDILAELERCKKHKCSYCGRSGANLGCSVGACRKQFHLPCGRERNALSLYYGSYKSFCQRHAPKQKIPEHIMTKAKLRMKAERTANLLTAVDIKQNCDSECNEDMVCVICYESVAGFPTVNTFWPPCCGKDAWFHRTCLQRMALSAGMHYLKCPLCNDKADFYEAVVEQGYYVPDRDAAWELEQNAFAEIYERPASCSADECLCPLGRGHDAENGKWDIKLCLLCGSAGAHAHCIDQSQARTEPDQSRTRDCTRLSTERNDADESNVAYTVTPSDTNKQVQESETSESNTSPEKSRVVCVRYVCESCRPAAPEDLSSLASSIEAIMQLEQAQSSPARRPLMPSRMSIRRTKGRRARTERPSSSRANQEIRGRITESPNVTSSRLELNLRPPVRKPPEPPTCAATHDDNKLFSPTKLLEHMNIQKVLSGGVGGAVLDSGELKTLRNRFRKPRPRCEKKRILDAILDGVFDDTKRNSRQKDQHKEWCSPNKLHRSIEAKDPQAEVNETHNQEMKKENNLNYINTPTKSPRNIKTEDTSIIASIKECSDIINEIADQNLINCIVIENKVKIGATPSRSTTRKYQDDKNYEIDEDIRVGTKDRNGKGSNEIKSYINCKTDIKDYFNCKTSIVDDVNCNTTVKDNEIDSSRENCNTDVLETDTEANVTPKRKSKQRNKKTRSSKKANNEIDNDIETSNSSRTENIIEDSPAKNVEDNGREYKKSSCNTLVTKDNKSNEIEKERDRIEEIQLNISTDKINNTSEGAVQQVDKSENVSTNTKNGARDKFKKLSLNRKTLKKDKITSLKGVEKSYKHASAKDFELNISRKHTKSESSKKEVNILKRLLTEKDLCSQLLLELTTGKVNDNNPVSNASDCNETQEAANESRKELNEFSKTISETPESLQTLVKYNHIKSSQNQTCKNMQEISEASINDSDNLNKTLEDSTQAYKRLDDIPKRTNKTLKRKSRKRLNKALKRDRRRLMHAKQITKKRSNKRTKQNKTLKDQKDISKELNQAPKYDSPIYIDDSRNNVTDTPKRKTIEIQQDSSLEISENNQSINIDVIKIADSPTTSEAYKQLKMNLPEQTKTCFKFSPLDKETLEKYDIGIDLESFKMEYLSEVDREFKCIFKHRHAKNTNKERKFRSPIDFALDAVSNKNIDNDSDVGRKKRKVSESGVKLVLDHSVPKKRKTSVSNLNLGGFNDTYEIANEYNDNSTVDNPEGEKKVDKDKRRIKKTKEKKNKISSSDNKHKEATIDSSEKRSAKNKKIKKKIKTKFAFQNRNIHVTPRRWKKKELSLNFGSKKQSKREMKILEKRSKLKQYVLQFPEGSSKEVLVKPEKEVCLLKRKYVKHEKSPDKMKQMSIQSFFKVTTEKSQS